MDGTPIRNLGATPHKIALSEASSDVVVTLIFSNKPAGGYPSFFEKIEQYVSIISGPAMSVHGVSPYTSRVYESGPEDAVFKFRDMLTTRAEISDLASLFKDDVVAVIGLGGSGAYLLDFLTKTPVREVRAFDPDPFHVHNAFRSPGHLDESELGLTKAEVYEARYQNFRNGVSCSAKFIDADSAGDLKGVTFAFVCVDKGSSRSVIFDLLISMNIPFIDVGMGLDRKHGTVDGQIRTTAFVDRVAQVRAQSSAPTHDNPDHIYKTTIQISELNALNACIAILKFKQIRGFYASNAPAFELILGISSLKIMAANDDV
jgi:hypothetical protein